MRKKIYPVSDKLLKILSVFGANIKAARERRSITIIEMAERIEVSVSTIIRLEKGSYDLPIATYLQAMYVLGLEKELEKLCSEDLIGEEFKLSGKKFAHRRVKGYISRKEYEDKKKNEAADS